MDGDQATIEDQFVSFSKLFDYKRSGETITLYRSDYWLRQADVLDDRKLNMCETGVAFFKNSKTELTFDEWREMISELCAMKNFDEQLILDMLTNCGLPGQKTVEVPQFRGIYCDAVYDGYLCWPPTPAGHTATQHCPDVRLSDPTQFAFRQCGIFGRWLGRHGNDTNSNGWTNYTPCFPDIVRSLLYKVYDEDETDAKYKFEIAENTRIIEIIGFTFSFVSLTVSLFILHYYTALNNLRTRIHKNLFIAMNAQVIIRLILYIDQAVMRRDAESSSGTGISLIENIPYVCVAVYVMLEFFITVMFMWMLNEGYYLNTLINTNALRENNSYKYFWVLGWFVPLLITTGWFIAAAIQYSKDPSLGCWYGYNFLTYFWLMQGPRLSVILTNFCFLLNIMRVLVVKLRQDNSSDVVKARKAVKAAMVLLPLLGITNILSMFEGPIGGPIWAFALWSYVTHTLRSFQGAFIAHLYCLCNAEVQAVVSKSWSNQLTIFRYRHPQMARFLRIGPQRRRRRGEPAGPHRPSGPHGPGGPDDGPGGSGMRPGDIQLRVLPLWTPQSQRLTIDSDPRTSNVSETEFGRCSIEARRQQLAIEASVTIEAPPSGPRFT